MIHIDPAEDGAVYELFIQRVRQAGEEEGSVHWLRQHPTYMNMYPLYMRGDPNWQTVNIPYTKFFNKSHGRVADRQESFILQDISVWESRVWTASRAWYRHYRVAQIHRNHKKANTIFLT